MCVSIPSSAFNPTEDICGDCSGKDTEDGEPWHGFCDEYNTKPCACRNSDHKLLTPTAMYEKMLKAMNLNKENVNA